MDFSNNLFETIWDTSFWLPKDSSWDEIYEYTKLDFKRMLVQCCVLACVITQIRNFFERYIAQPIGAYLNIPGKSPFKPNSVLETYYADKKIINDSVIMLISKENNLEYDYIKNWFQARKSLNKPSVLQKFCESSWRCTFYFLVWLFGYYVVHDKSWFADTNECWVNYPRQYLTDDVYIYYVIEIAFYFSLVVSQFSDVKRKDFWQMFVHHIVTLLLLIFSLTCNFQRIGSLVIILHDTADSSLELAKLGSYAKKKWVSDPVFGFFVITWCVTRIYIYPTKILNSTIYEAQANFEGFPAYWGFNYLLCALQIMHLIWTWMIFRILYKVLFLGVSEDDRSEVDEHEHKE